MRVKGKLLFAAFFCAFILLGIRGLPSAGAERPPVIERTICCRAVLPQEAAPAVTADLHTEKTAAGPRTAYRVGTAQRPALRSAYFRACYEAFHLPDRAG